MVGPGYPWRTQEILPGGKRARPVDGPSGSPPNRFAVLWQSLDALTKRTGSDLRINFGAGSSINGFGRAIALA